MGVEPAQSEQHPRGMVLTPALRWIAIAALVAGLLTRTLPLLYDAKGPLTTCDGRAYHTLALNLVAGRGLYVDDPVTVEKCAPQVPIGPSHHYAPAMAFVEALFIVWLGDSLL